MTHPHCFLICPKSVMPTSFQIAKEVVGLWGEENPERKGM